MPGPTALALLRGINVGGRNKLPMAALTSLFVEAGCENVRTFIQSGNVIYSAPPAISARLAATVSANIAARFGCNVPVILRTTRELREVISNNPFLNAGAGPDFLHVLFLADVPDAAKVAALNPDQSPPDAFTVRGREIYLQLPNGVAATKLSNGWFDRKLQTIGTMRNWRTILRLRQMMQA